MNGFYLQMHITNRCSNRCRHCYQNNYSDEMMLQDAIAVLNELSRIGKENEVTTEVSITGGDPLFHPSFWEILKNAKRLCDKVYIMGNPEMLMPKTIFILKKIEIDLFQLSLDGIGETHDRQRSPKSFERTCKAITALSNAGIKVNVNMTMTDQNRHQKNTVAAIAKTMGAQSFSCEECIPHGEDCNGRNSHKCSLGFSVMAILPDLTLMACRRTPSSVLGKWTHEQGLEYHFVNNPKMISYREKHEAAKIQKEERRKNNFQHQALAREQSSEFTLHKSRLTVHEHWARESDSINPETLFD